MINFCSIRTHYFLDICKKIHCCFNTLINNDISNEYEEFKHLKLIRYNMNSNIKLNDSIRGFVTYRKNHISNNTNKGFYTSRAKLSNIKSNNEFAENMLTPKVKEEKKELYSSFSTKFTPNTNRSIITVDDFTPESQNSFHVFPHPYMLNNHLTPKKVESKNKNKNYKTNFNKSEINLLDVSSVNKRTSDLLTYRENTPYSQINNSKIKSKFTKDNLRINQKNNKLYKEWIEVNMLLLLAAHDRIIQNTKIKIEQLTLYTRSSKFNGGFHKEFDLIEEGSFGKVYRGKYNNIDVAVKVPNLSTMETDPIGVTDRIIREWKLLARIKHPNIIGLQGGIILPNRHIWLVTNLINGCDLHSFKHKHKESIPIEKSFKMIMQLITVIDFLHTPTREKGIIIHRDIKPENIIVDKKNWNIYLCDFGDAEEFGSGNKRKLSGATWLYSPIELLKADPIEKEISNYKITQYNEKWDIWSFGCVLQEFFGYENPFEYIVQCSDDSNQIYSKLVTAVKENRYKPYIPQNIHPTIKKIIQMCLQPNPFLRPNAKVILNILEKTIYKNKSLDT